MQDVTLAKRLLAIGIFVAACFLAVASSLLLVRSVEVGVALYTIASVVVLLTIEPFIGLIYFVLFFYLSPQVLVPALSAVPLTLITGVAACGSMWIRAALGGSQFRVFNVPQNYLVAWFTLAIVISPLARLDFQESISATYDWMVNVVLFVLITGLVTTGKRLRIILHVIVLATLWLAIQGIVQYFTGIGFAGDLDADERIEAIGMYGDPNNLALHLLLVVPLLYSEFTRGSSGLSRAYALTSLLILIGAIYLTNSRGGVLSFAAVMAILFVRRHGLVAGIFFAAAAFTMILAFGPSRVREVSATEPSAYGRILMWNESFRLFFSHPVFGVGAGRFAEASALKKAAHNSFLNCASELGVFGLLPWVLLIYISIKNAFYVSRQAIVSNFKHLGIHAEGIAFGLLAFVFAAIFLSTTYAFGLMMFVGLSVAATNIFVDNGQERYQLFEKGDLFRGLLLAAGGLIIFKLFLMMV